MAVGIKRFKHPGELLLVMASYPRRVKHKDRTGLLSFYSDDGANFEITLKDLTQSLSNKNIEKSHKVKVFVDAWQNKKLDDWCEGLNYGKPDFKESSC